MRDGGGQERLVAQNGCFDLLSFLLHNSETMHALTASLEKLERIVFSDLCLRCGACVAICPISILSLNDKSFPIIVDLANCNDCQLCLKVCPGHEVDLATLAAQLFGQTYPVSNTYGIFEQLYVGHATDEEVRQRGGSGGLITQLLLYLSRRKEIQGAVVVRADPTCPWKGKPWIARSEAEILESAQSKYCIVPLDQILGEIKREKGPFALVGLPCHIHALRKWAAIDRRWETRVPLIIGLFCHLSLEEEAPLDLMRLKRISPTEVDGFEYRGGEWPGVIRAHLKSGEVKNLHHPDMRGYVFTYLSYLYYSRRCLYCLDASSELADLSVADPWLRDAKGNWKYPGGWSMVIARTRAGLELLHRASADGAVVLEQLSPSYLRRAHDPMAAVKKRDNLFRLERLARKGQPYPDYHLEFPQLSRRERWKAWVSCLPSLLGKYRLVRKAVARIIFSPLGTPLAELRIYLKKRRQRCL